MIFIETIIERGAIVCSVFAELKAHFLGMLRIYRRTWNLFLFSGQYPTFQSSARKTDGSGLTGRCNRVQISPYFKASLPLLNL